MTQKQVYYYWAVQMKAFFLRDADQFLSAVKLLEEMSSFRVLYVEQNAPRSIAFTTSIGIHIRDTRSIREVYIDSTRTYIKLSMMK